MMRHAIIVPLGLVSGYNQVAREIGIDSEGAFNTLSVPLVPSDGPGNANPSHYGACGQIPESARTWLRQNSAQFPGALWWCYGSDRKLVNSHDGQGIGDPWSWRQSLAAAGLKPQEPAFT